jgi:hypothetical protein
MFTLKTFSQFFPLSGQIPYALEALAKRVILMYKLLLGAHQKCVSHGAENSEQGHFYRIDI